MLTNDRENMCSAHSRRSEETVKERVVRGNDEPDDHSNGDKAAKHFYDRQSKNGKTGDSLVRDLRRGSTVLDLMSERAVRECPVPEVIGDRSFVASSSATKTLKESLSPPTSLFLFGF